MNDILKQKIEVEVYFIHQFCQEYNLTLICDLHGNSRERTAQDDWLDAESKILAGLEQERA
jgi:hypothetical protein